MTTTNTFMLCEVVRDRAGVSGRVRLTCRTHGKTLVAQPWMAQAVWDDLASDFLDEHPCVEIPEIL